MKRPIADLLTMTLKAGMEADHMQSEHQAWQILRRKQGYVTHRLYQQRNEPLERLVYSEWESKKAADGARQPLQGTPLTRRARAALAATPRRLVVELVGAVTSTKGLDLPAGAVAVHAVARLGRDAAQWREVEDRLTKTLAGLPGRVAHVLFRGFDEPLLVGSLSHWIDADAFEKARAPIDGVVNAAGTLAAPLAYVLYDPVRD